MPVRRVRVDFVGQVREIAPGQELTFGRNADIVIDDNRHLHRVLGRIIHTSNIWWLVNEGRHISIEITDVDSRSSGIVSPGARFALSFPRCLLRFRAGASNYELELEVDVPSPDAAAGEQPTLRGDSTISHHDLPLTEDQRALLVALASDQLRHPKPSITVPTNREMAQRLGWSLSKFERKLDNVCQKFTKAGVPGLHGRQGELAKDRRRRLIEYSLETGIVTPRDLDPEPETS